MAFSNSFSDTFGRVFEHTPYTALDPILKCHYVARGKNLIFGRTSERDSTADLLYLGKIFESASGQNYLGADAWLDTSFPHVIYITGTRGSGKSFDLGVLLEGIANLKEPSPVQREITPIASFLIDTQSQFWTLMFPPSPVVSENAEQLKQLETWNLKSNSLSDVSIFVPPGAPKFIGCEIDLRIRPADVRHEEWCDILEQDVYGPQGHILANALEAMGSRNYDLEDIINWIDDDDNCSGVADSSRNVLLYRLRDYNRTGLFSRDGIDVRSLLRPGGCNIFMLRELRDADKSLITAILARQLFTVMGKHHHQRKVNEFFGREDALEQYPSRVWLLIDEAHVVAPSAGQNAARAALVEYVKRGRDAGLSLVLATQQPSAVDDRILSQVNVALSHRLTFQSDINAAVNRVPTKPLSGLRVSGSKLSEFGDMLRLLESGQCFIGDHGTSRTILLQVRPRISAHGGYSPL